MRDSVQWTVTLFDGYRDRLGIAFAAVARNNVADGAGSVDCWET